MAYTTPAEDAKQIRETLKREHGWNRNHVSVRASSFSMGSSISVEIKRADVDENVVREIALRAQRIDRCELTGDILAGCNRYVHVDYSTDARAELAGEYVPAVEKALAELETLDQNTHANIDGTELTISRAHGHDTVQVWGADGPWHINDCKHVEAIAFDVARMVRNGNRVVRGS